MMALDRLLPPGRLDAMLADAVQRQRSLDTSWLRARGRPGHMSDAEFLRLHRLDVPGDRGALDVRFTPALTAFELGQLTVLLELLGAEHGKPERIVSRPVASAARAISTKDQVDAADDRQDAIWKWLDEAGYRSAKLKKALVLEAMAKFGAKESTVRRAIKRGRTAPADPT